MASSAGVGLPGPHPEIRAFLAAPRSRPRRKVFSWIYLVSNLTGGPLATVTNSCSPRWLARLGRIYENGYYYTIATQRADALEHEIAERKKAEWALRQERDRAQLYLDTAGVILACARHGRADHPGESSCMHRAGLDGRGPARSRLHRCLRAGPDSS